MTVPTLKDLAVARIMAMPPVWKSLEPMGFAKYEVSQFGRVRNATTGKELSICSHLGYNTINMSDDDNKRRCLPVSHCVLWAFGFSRPSENHLADHVDCSQYDIDHLSNLRWATRTEQSLNRRTPERRLSRPVVKISDNGVTRYESAHAASIAEGLSKHTIYAWLQGRGCADGVQWKYEESADLDFEVWYDFRPEGKSTGVAFSDQGRVKDARGGRHVSKRHSGDYLTERGRSVNAYPVMNIDGRMWAIHTAAALAFFGPRPAGYVVHHIDDDRTNTRLDNLKYVTQSENIAAAHGSGRFDHGKSKRKRVRVEDREYESVTAAANDLGVSRTAMCHRIKSGKATVV